MLISLGCSDSQTEFDRRKFREDSCLLFSVGRSGLAILYQGEVHINMDRRFFASCRTRGEALVLFQILFGREFQGIEGARLRECVDTLCDEYPLRCTSSLCIIRLAQCVQMKSTCTRVDVIRIGLESHRQDCQCLVSLATNSCRSRF